MKKYTLILLSFLLFVISFVVFWFKDQLFNALYLFILPVYFILFACLVTLLVMSVVSIVKYKAYIQLVAIAVLALLVVTAVFFPFRDAKVKLDLDIYEADRMEIVEMIMDGRLRPSDNYGNINLPAGYCGISTGGSVYQYQNDENGQVICFWVDRGFLGYAIEVVYSSEGEELIRANRINITRIEKLKDHWYYVFSE